MNSSIFSSIRSRLAAVLIALPALSHAINPPTPPGYENISLTYSWTTGRQAMAWVDPTVTDPSGVNPSARGIYALDNGVLYRIEFDGTRTALGSGRYWANVSSSGASAGPSMTAYGANLYIVANGYLYRVNPVDGGFTQLGGHWWDRASFITCNRSTGKLYIMHNSSIFSVPMDGTAPTQLTPAWWDRATAFQATGNGVHFSDPNQFMIVHAGRFYTFPIPTSMLSTVPNQDSQVDWGSAMLAPDFWTSRVYAVSNSNLVRTTSYPTDGGTIDGTGDSGYWRLAQSMCTGDDYFGHHNLYIISDGSLFRKGY